MKEAYGQLYEIETSLRDFIQLQMVEEYGPIWYHKAFHKIPHFSRRGSFNHIYLYDLEVFLHRFPCFSDIPEGFFRKLRDIYSIRNKIAHCHDLTEKEFQMLQDSHTFIINYLDPTYKTPVRV